MNNYIYQAWFRGKRKLQSEEDTLNYYLKHVHYPEYLKEEGKKAKKFLKTCNNVEEWARYAYANDLPFVYVNWIILMLNVISEKN